MTISSNKLIILTAIFIVAVDNAKFFSELIQIYPVSKASLGFIISTGVVLCAMLVAFFALFNFKPLLKPVLAFSLFCASLISYFSNTYNIVFDRTMIQNVVETNISESFDLFSFKLLLHVIVLGIVPSVIIFRTRMKVSRFRKSC